MYSTSSARTCVTDQVGISLSVEVVGTMSTTRRSVQWLPVQPLVCPVSGPGGEGGQGSSVSSVSTVSSSGLTASTQPTWLLSEFRLDSRLELVETLCSLDTMGGGVGGGGGGGDGDLTSPPGGGGVGGN